MSIAITQSDVSKHGCPYCNHGKVYFRLSGGGSTLYKCSNRQCDRGYWVVEDGMAETSWKPSVKVTAHPNPR